ncbi:hypothetical protein LJC52_00780 [Bacteroidales bacterium OttesenSCG-928-A17]|nr:hypothetical protein [Bacteroidales bacterium OttesenSCG-928-A17]
MDHTEKENIENKASKSSSFDLIESFLKNKSPEDLGSDLLEFEVLSEEKIRAAVSSDYLSYLIDNERDIDTATIPMQHQDRIDDFISANEKQTFRMELKNISEENTDETDLSDDEELPENNFFSETLAKIYIKQRKYDKALKIIRELHLLYPEKNRYFADQIRFLEKLIINTSKIK